MKGAVIPIVSFILSLLTVTSVSAMGSSHMQSNQCPNPTGMRIADFSDGWHAVVGFSQNLWGADTVTNVGNQNFIQCFCPTVQSNQVIKSGIQSDWLFTGNVSTTQQQRLINTGWQLRHDGTSFGLPQNDFLVKNFSFSCKNIGNVSIKRTFTTQVHNESVSTQVKSNTTHFLTK